MSSPILFIGKTLEMSSDAWPLGYTVLPILEHFVAGAMEEAILLMAFQRLHGQCPLRLAEFTFVASFYHNNMTSSSEHRV